MRKLSVTDYSRVYAASRSTVHRWRRTRPDLNLEDPREVLDYVMSQKSYPAAFDLIADVTAWVVSCRCEILILQGRTKTPC